MQIINTCIADDNKDAFLLRFKFTETQSFNAL